MWGRPDRDLVPTPSPLVDQVNFEPAVGDFDGDGAADIFWYGPGNDLEYLWWGATSRAFAYDGAPAVDQAHFDPTVGDYNGDGFDDIFWFAPGYGSD